MFTIATLIETEICNCLSTMQFHSHLKKSKIVSEIFHRECGKYCKEKFKRRLCEYFLLQVFTSGVPFQVNEMFLHLQNVFINKTVQLVE